MTVQFVDTYYLLALLNTRDHGHDTAVRHSQGRASGLITTTWVLVEFADALSAVDSRKRAVRFIRGFQAEPFVEVVPPTHEQFERAMDRYEERPDKDWSLTDCLSFLLMEERGITDALTADLHFVQAGFRALMREPQA
ncbi:MAG: PIN domain-containing protein [Pirellulales bacterium]